MALLRKKESEWFPSENKELKVGETIEISDYRRLVELGAAELVDEAGNVLPLPGTVFVCGICYDTVGSHSEYIAHILKNHANQTTLGRDTADKVEESPAAGEIKVPDAFGQKMAKARAEARAKREEAKKQAAL